jgi:hypothetical protein
MPSDTPEFVAKDLNGNRKALYKILTRSKGKGTKGIIATEELLYNDG